MSTLQNTFERTLKAIEAVLSKPNEGHESEYSRRHRQVAYACARAIQHAIAGRHHQALGELAAAHVASLRDAALDESAAPMSGTTLASTAQTVSLILKTDAIAEAIAGIDHDALLRVARELPRRGV